MAHFGRIVWRGALDNESSLQFMALIELVKRKRKVSMPSSFILARHTRPHNSLDTGRNEMVRIKVRCIEQELKRFWPQGTEGERGFPNCAENRWEKTTSWLCPFVVDSWYDSSLDTWLKVGRPRRWKKRKSRNSVFDQSVRLLKIGYIRGLKKEKINLQNERLAFEENKDGAVLVLKENLVKHKEICRKLERLECAIRFATRGKPEIQPAFLKPMRRIRGDGRRVVASQ